FRVPGARLLFAKSQKTYLAKSPYNTTLSENWLRKIIMLVMTMPFAGVAGDSLDWDTDQARVSATASQIDIVVMAIVRIIIAMDTCWAAMRAPRRSQCSPSGERDQRGVARAVPRSVARRRP